MVLKSQYSLLVSIDSLDPARSKIGVRFEQEEDPESEQMKQLIESIRKDGILYPLLVRPKSKDRYEVIAGNRRLAAARALRLEHVPIVIKDLNDAASRRLAFIENAIRKEVNAMQKAKGIVSLYEDAGIDRTIAIQKVKYLHNIKMRDVKEYEMILADASANRNTPKGNKASIDAEPTIEFLEIFKDIPLAANTQYQLLQTIVKIPEATREILEQASALPTNKAVLLTNTQLDKYPEQIRHHLAEQIIDPKMSVEKGRALVSQTIADLEAGRTTVENNGMIDFGYGSGKGHRSDPEESVTAEQELEQTFDIEILDIIKILMKNIGKILHIQIPKGNIRYEPSLYKPALAEFEKNLKTLKKSDKAFCAEQAAIMGRICNAIIKSI